MLVRGSGDGLRRICGDGVQMRRELRRGLGDQRVLEGGSGLGWVPGFGDWGLLRFVAGDLGRARGGTDLVRRSDAQWTDDVDFPPCTREQMLDETVCV